MNKEEFDKMMTQTFGDKVINIPSKEKVETAKYITILDFEVSRVFQYKVKSSDFGPHLLEYYDDSDYEEYLTNKGHNLSNCEWMAHENGDIINKTGDLPF